MNHSPKLLLFDIDGTLLDTGGVGLRSLKRGFIECFSLEDQQHDFPSLNLGGATDSSIVEFLFPKFGIEESSENRERFFSQYLDFLKLELENSGRNVPLPGAKSLLMQLVQKSELTLGLLTGNIARGAFTKVDHFGLGGIFEFGAFGDDHADRNKLGPIGISRAAEFSGTKFEPHDVFIIGDTPKDIACARACGAVAVAVASGASPKEELADLKPDFLFSNFEAEQDEFFAMLTK